MWTTVITPLQEIILYSYGDKFEEGLSLRLYSDEEGDYYLDYGEEKTEQRVSKDVILDLATALIHLRDSDSLMDMALENRGDSEKFIKNPSILELP